MDFDFKDCVDDVLVVAGVAKGCPYIRVTLFEPISMAMEGTICWGLRIFPQAIRERVVQYKEREFKYIDVPRSEKDRFELFRKQEEEFENIDVLRIKDPLSNAVCVIPRQNMASIDMRMSYPGKFSQLWNTIKRRCMLSLKVAAIILGFSLAILQILYIVTEWMNV